MKGRIVPLKSFYYIEVNFRGRRRTCWPTEARGASKGACDLLADAAGSKSIARRRRRGQNIKRRGRSDQAALDLPALADLAALGDLNSQ